MNAQDSIERRVEAVLARVLPAVDLLEVRVAGPETLRVTVDHPDGVDHGVCADVTHALEADGLLDQYGIEVWSPGPEPPLRTVEHFRRAVGRRVQIRVGGAHGGHAHRGTLVEADDRVLRLSDGQTLMEIPFSEVREANALESSGVAE
jgi:ribosome maturation factor RimP